jgi:hypothetical protein
MGAVTRLPDDRFDAELRGGPLTRDDLDRMPDAGCRMPDAG